MAMWGPEDFLAQVPRVVAGARARDLSTTPSGAVAVSCERGTLLRGRGLCHSWLQHVCRRVWEHATQCGAKTRQRRSAAPWDRAEAETREPSPVVNLLLKA